MTLVINGCVSNKEIEHSLHTLLEEARTRVSDQDFIDKITELVEGALDVASFAPSYDFPGVQANGFRSLIELAIRLIRFGLVNYEDKENAEFDRQFKLFVKCAVDCYANVRFLHENFVKNSKSDALSMRLSKV